MLTLAQLRAAQNNDLAGISAVLTELDSRINRLAAQAARRIAGASAEDFAQDAREALFLALPRVAGDSVDTAIGFLYTSMADALKDKVRAERYQGADKDAVKVFMAALGEADGDAHKAEQIIRDLPKGQRLSVDRAQAARLAWQGVTSLDKPHGEGDLSLAETLADEAAVAEHWAALEIRPKVGHGAALEALAVLQRYSAAYGVLNALPGTAEDVDAIEDAVILPRDAAQRRYVLDAVAILRSYVSTATDGDLIDELRDVADECSDQRAATISGVREVINTLSPAQAAAICHTFGIAGHASYGRGDGSDVEGFAAALGTSVNSANKTRSLAFKNFAQRWIARVAKTLEEAMSWEAAAVAARARGGRK
ncbi:hypothetical protein [Streptomyces sp. NPDC003832]